jgi:excisionase family DNA binding protein
MEEFLKIGKAAEYIHVSEDTLRLWDKTGKLKAIKTAGGHRRYNIKQLDEFLGKNKAMKYGDLYNHLCSAQYIADEIGDDLADAILRIREEIGNKLLNEYGIKQHE